MGKRETSPAADCLLASSCAAKLRGTHLGKMTLALLAVLVAALVVVALLPQAAHAANPAYYAGAPAGTASTPATYDIGSEDQLAALATTVNSGQSYRYTTFMLTRDIAITGDRNGGTAGNWDPIGGVLYDTDTETWHRCCFDGTFDGDGWSISNLKSLRIIDTEYSSQVFCDSGLFGYLGNNASIQHLSVSVDTALADLAISKVLTAYVGGIAARADGGTITDCSVSGTINMGTATNLFGSLVSGEVHAGGIVGFVGNVAEQIIDRSFSLYGCTNSATMNSFVRTTGSSFNGENSIGGLVGFMSANTGEIRQCTNTADASIQALYDCRDSDQIHLGGIVGNANILDYLFDSCVNEGAIGFTASTDATGTPDVRMGGIMGLCDSEGDDVVRNITMKNCSSTGGFSAAGNATYLFGGIAGDVDHADIINCSATVGSGAAPFTVAGYEMVFGGIVGEADICAVENCSTTGAFDLSGFGCAGGIVGRMGTGGYVANCYNNIAVDLVNEDDTTRDENQTVYVGGITGLMAGPLADRDLAMSDCYNSGNVHVGNHNFGYRDGYSETYIGGIAGRVRDGAFADCRNDGSVSGFGARGGSDTPAYIGGILGAAHLGTSVDEVTLQECVNQGTVSNDASSASDYYYELWIGGIGGEYHGSSAMDCINYGEIQIHAKPMGASPHEGPSRIVAGGLFGQSTTYSLQGSKSDGNLDIEMAQGDAWIGGLVGILFCSGEGDTALQGLISKADISVTFLEDGSAVVGGIAGSSGLPIIDCVHIGDLSTHQADGYAGCTSIVAGIVASTIGDYVRNCYNWGNVIAEGNSVEKGDTAHVYAGGIACNSVTNNTQDANLADIQNCVQVGDVSATQTSNSSGEQWAGGLLDSIYVNSEPNAHITNNYVAGTIPDNETGLRDFVGGVVNGEEGHIYTWPGNTMVASGDYDRTSPVFTLTNTAFGTTMLNALNDWLEDPHDHSYSSWTTDGTYHWPSFDMSIPVPITMDVDTIVSNLNAYANDGGYRIWEKSEANVPELQVSAGQPAIVTANGLPDVLVNERFSYQLQATGDAPITFNLVSGGGDLPAGVQLSSAGGLSGTPTQTGTYTFSVQASNNTGDDVQTMTLGVYDLLPAHHVTVRATGSGTCTPTGKVGVQTGGSFTVRLVPDSRFYPVLIENGSEVDLEDQGDGSYTYTLSDVSADHVLRASFYRMSNYPDAPASATLMPGYQKMDITWTEPEDNGGSPIVQYLVYRTDSEYGGYKHLVATVDAGDRRAYTDDNVTVGWSYGYIIYSKNADGYYSLFWETAYTDDGYKFGQPYQEPEAVDDLVATAVNGQIDLTWTQPECYGRSNAIDRYDIYRKIGSGAFGTTPIASVVPARNDDNLSYSDTVVSVGTSYSYRVIAHTVNDLASGENASKVAGPVQLPAAPTAPSAPNVSAPVPGDTSVRLSWTPPTDSGPDGATITGYKVYRNYGGETGTDWTLISGENPISAAMTEFTDDFSDITPTTNPNGQVWQYRITAVNSANKEGAVSAIVSATPEAPQGAMEVVPASGTLSWTLDEGYTNPDTKEVSITNTGNCDLTFVVTRISTGEEILDIADWSATLAPNDSAESFPAPRTGLTPGVHTETFQVTGIYMRHGEYQSVDPVDITVTVNVNRTPVAPSAPQNVQAVAGNAQVTLSWTPPVDNGGAAIDHYFIYRSTTSGALGEKIAESFDNVQSYIDTGLANGTTYYYTVSAHNTVGEGAKSTQVSATPSTTMPPSAPQNLGAVAGDAQVSLTWDAPASDGGSAVEVYNVYRTTDSSNPRQESLGGGLGADVHSYADDTAVNGTTYYYSVSAGNSAGEGDLATSAAITPRAPATVTRLQGTDRIGTMEAIVGEAYGQGETCDAVIVTTAWNFADALVASGLAGVLGCPVVTTDGWALSEAAERTIERLSPSKAYVLGDDKAVAGAVDDELRVLGVEAVERLAGDGRFATNMRIYEEGVRLAREDVELDGWSSTAIVAKGWNYADALAAAPYAYAARCPLFLAQADGTLPQAAADAILGGGFERVVVLGSESGDGAVLDVTLAAQLPGVERLRLAGATRLETSAAIAGWATGQAAAPAFGPDVALSWDGMALAVAWNYADALASVGLLGKARSVLLLADGTQTSLDMVSRLAGDNAGSISKAYVLGSTNALPAAVEDNLRAALGL